MDLVVKKQVQMIYHKKIDYFTQFLKFDSMLVWRRQS